MTTTERPCITCGQSITITTRNPTRRFCSPRCRVADWHGWPVSSVFVVWSDGKRQWSGAMKTVVRSWA
jgi:endogenous inhibitor of DNA gyrase (YacG/DUF329 family)